jgi:RHS repeat-associated protein
VTASFVYDGDGNRVKGTVNGTTTAYVGNYYEWSGSASTMKKYYYAGSLRLAMRTGSGTGTTGLLWLLGDHLGSTSKAANPNGTLYTGSEQRYKAWGEKRFPAGSSTAPTTYRYTGQRQEKDLGGADGLYFYQSRWYDPQLGRFLSADTLIPDPGDPVSYDRYAYSRNNPVRYTDPSGHDVDCGIGESGCHRKTAIPKTTQSTLLPVPTEPTQSLIPKPAPTQSPRYVPNDGTYTPVEQPTDDFTGFWELDRLDGIGVRVDFSGWLAAFPIFGGDFDIDIIVRDDLQIAIYLVPSGILGAGEGASFVVGVVGYYDAPAFEDPGGYGYGGQLNLSAGGGVALSYSYSDKPGSYGRHAQTWFFGIGSGIQASVGFLPGFTVPWMTFGGR